MYVCVVSHSTHHWQRPQKHLWIVVGFQSVPQWGTPTTLQSSTRTCVIITPKKTYYSWIIIVRVPCCLVSTCKFQVDFVCQYFAGRLAQPWSISATPYEQQTWHCWVFRWPLEEGRCHPQCSSEVPPTSKHEHTAQIPSGTLRSSWTRNINKDMKADKLLVILYKVNNQMIIFSKFIHADWIVVSFIPGFSQLFRT